jgi:hypothetical protein
MRHYTGDLTSIALAAERRPRLLRERRLSPLVGGLREHLDRRGTDGPPARRRGVHPSLGRNVGADQVGDAALMHSTISDA